MSREARAAKIVADLIIPSERRFYAAYADFQRTLKAEQLRRLRELPKGTPAASFPFALQPWQAAVWQATRKTYATIIRVGIGAGVAEVEATRKGFHGEQRLNRVVREFAQKPLEVTIPRGYQEAIQATVATSRERIARRIYEQIEITGLDDRDALAAAAEAEFALWRYGRDVAVSADQGGGAIAYGRNEGHVIAGVELMDWVTAGDERVRETHVTLGNSGPRAEGFDWATLVGGGGPLRFPHDPDAEDLALVVNCRCVLLPAEQQ